jgi:S-adenosylmethionine:tRNA ribosyltransferase-isomerase
MIDFALPTALEAHEPPEARGMARDGVRLLATTSSGVTHHLFRDLPDLLKPGDLLVVNDSATLPAAVRLDRLSVHFSTPLPGGEPEREWIVELRLRSGKATEPYGGGELGEWFPMPGCATLTLVARVTDRLWHVRLNTDVVPYLRRYGLPIRYGYVRRDWPISAYQTVFARDFTVSEPFASPDSGSTPQPYKSARTPTPTRARDNAAPTAPAHGTAATGVTDAGSGGEAAGDAALWGQAGSAEMPSAARPFTSDLVTRLVARGVLFAPITLHTGVASPEAHEPPYAERFAVSETTADLVNHVRARGGRVIAVGTTAVRALESAASPEGVVRPRAGWTEHVITPEGGVRVVDGLLTGLHEPRSSHLMMLTAIAGTEILERTYAEALAEGYLWHEFGDLNLLLPS